MSLTRTSAIMSSCGSSTFEIQKATVQARMVSGRYRTCWLRRHFSQGESGVCRVPGCTGEMQGTLVHLATGQCPGLVAAVAKAARHWNNYLTNHPLLFPLIQEMSCADPEDFLKFLLNPATQPGVIAIAQRHGWGSSAKSAISLGHGFILCIKPDLSC